MAKKPLIIVESPTKAHTIGNFLGKDCKIIASKGHVRTLPKIGMAIDIDNGYQPEYIIDETKKPVIAEMKSALKDADELILATDEDREGESISWHLLQILNPKVPYRRMVFHEITKSAITKAFENGRDLDMNLVHAQEARRVLDRLYGYTISPVLWSKLSNKTLSAGRVQSPGLRLIVDRERARINFTKQQYWDVQALFAENFTSRLESVDSIRIATGKDFDSETGAFNAASKARLLTWDDTQLIITSLKSAAFKVSDIKEKSFYSRPSEPFRTSTLQQEGNRKLHLSAKDTMSVAQSLYEKGFITYMRTDSVSLSVEGTQAARNAVKRLYGEGFVSDSPRKYQNGTQNAQEAHEAIRPAGEVFRAPEETGLSGRELALYTMIFKRTLACQMKDALKTSTTIAIDANNCRFTASGTRIEFPGFMKVYVEGTDEEENGSGKDGKEEVMPKLTVGQTLTVKELTSVSHETKEPARFTEASLVQELEKKGIGRPSTYASIIERILEKQYVIKENNALVPTFTGFGVIQLLEHFKQYIKYDFTSKMEQDLDEIAEGKLEEVEYLKEFYEGENGLEQQVQKIKDTIVPMDVKQIHLKQISKDNTITIGKYGPYVQDAEGKYFSVPESWRPWSVTNEMVDSLKSKSTEKTATPVVGTTPDGQPILYCTGRFGDYWQIGDIKTSKEVKRFKVPTQLLGKSVSVDRIMELFNLPRTVGKAEDGTVITADIGRFGPYLKCGDEYRNLKDFEALFSTTETEARILFSTPKETSRKAPAARKSTYKRASSKPKAEPAIVNDFGEQNGSKLFITVGKYGYYLKHGDSNIRLASKYQHDEAACKAMKLDEALSYLKK